MDVRRTILVGAALLLTVLLAGCATATQDQTPTKRAVLLDTKWALIKLNGNALIENTEITLNFEEASVAGSAGCNTYGGSYVASDSLKVSGVYATEMGCLEPKGILEQERTYLDALDAAAAYRVDGDRLDVYDASSTQILELVASSAVTSMRGTPTSEPAAPTTAVTTAPTSTPVPPSATPSPAPPTATVTRVPPTETATPEPPEATAIPSTVEPPAGFKRYVDAASGVCLFVPESWTIVEPGPQGGTTILQSYPADKYIGGEARQPGDSKCDLTVHPPDTKTVDLVQRIRSDPSITIVTEQEIVLQTGRTGMRMEIVSMGPSLVLFAEVNERAVVLSCFGELEPFDEIAVTLNSKE